MAFLIKNKTNSLNAWLDNPDFLYRLCRFAFDFVEQLANYSDCKIIVANQTHLFPQEELCNTSAKYRGGLYLEMSHLGDVLITFMN